MRKVFWLNAKDIFYTEGQVKMIAANAFSEIIDWQPDILYFTDEIALQYVAIPYAQNVSNSTPIVFSGLSRQNIYLIAQIRALNFTGSLSLYPFDALVRNMSSLDPFITSMTFVCDDSIDGNLLYTLIQSEVASSPTWLPSRVFKFTYYSEYQTFVTYDYMVQSRSELLVLLEYQVSSTSKFIQSIFLNLSNAAILGGRWKHCSTFECC